MTRGKYAARSAARREAQAVEANTDAYQRQIVNLTQERDQLMARIAAERKSNAEVMRALRVERDASVSPELHARDRLIEELREELGRRNVAFADLQKKHVATARFLFSILEETGMTRVEAWEFVMKNLGRRYGPDPEPAGTITMGVTNKTSLSPDMVIAIQKARGIR